MDARMSDAASLATAARRARCVTATGLLCLAPLAWAAQPDGDHASLERGARPDTTAEQRYQSAIREAGGGLKAALAECRGQPASARPGCEEEARKRYQQDMSEARALLHPPGTRQPGTPAGPHKEVETRIVGKPQPGS